MESVIIEQRQYAKKFSTNQDKSNGGINEITTNFTNISLSSATRLKRSLSHKRKFAKKLPLIKKELESENNFKQCTERLIQSIMDCNLINLKQSLENGANANTRYNNWSLLHYACSMIDQDFCGTDQHLEIIRLLLDAGAQINSQDEDKWTPLHLACQLGITRVISYLIRKGADKDACTVENLRPIDLVEPDNYIALSFLISTSVNCNDRCL
jgi:hypothetical protein